MPMIKSELGEQVIQARPLRTFEVPDASEEEFAPLPSYVPTSGNSNYPNAEPISSFNARQAALRGHMTGEDVKRAEEAMRAAKQAKMGSSRLSPAAKKRLEMICGISRANRSVIVDGQTYVLQTLVGRETREALVAASRFDGTIESPFEVRRQMLARSLSSIAGTDIDLFLGGGDLEARLEMIEELPETLLVKLMDEYNKLDSEVRERYFPKTEEGVAEVIDDLKK